MEHWGLLGIGSEKQAHKRSGPRDMKNKDGRVNSSDKIGAYLQERRLSRDISLEEVSESTGIATAVLQALENEDRDNLPAEVYIKAFYKKYAEYLGVDAEEILAKYLLQNQSVKKAGRRSGFNTVVTLKGQEENLFAEILRRLFLPLVILVLGALFYWIYKNYLAAYSPLGFRQEHLPSVCSLLISRSPCFFC